MKRKKTPERKPHPDGRIELQLQRIIGCQEAISRQEHLITDYRHMMLNASSTQDEGAAKLRVNPGWNGAQAAFDKTMQVQQARIEQAMAGIATAEGIIEAQRDRLAKLSAEMSDTDLAYL